ncbi:MAG TPA: NUDIX domain-containing protein [Solirubrobacteraceae bacterium]|jgi:predicted NUDIX family NTP pyrophosphohydrolase
MTASATRAPRSAGILLYRRHGDELQVLLVHPGGPFWARKDHGVWSIPKGEYGSSEDPLAAARREFEEELGTAPPGGAAHDLGAIRQRAGKLVHAFGLEGDLDAGAITSNTCEIVWPPRSGRTITIPEVDRAEWFALGEARERILPAQAELLDRLAERV